VRLGLYKTIADDYKKKNKRDLSLPGKMAASAFSGFVGSLVGNPADLCLVRFQSDSTLPLKERRNYKNVFDALSRIVKEEGLVTLWRGSAPTILRAISMNLGKQIQYF
jgi:solute carrier family 25 oxoglutarate transporter 11